MSYQNRKMIIKNEDETKKFGIALADEIKAGDVIALSGELGTGKTALTKYIAEALGVKEEVTSPTFTIVKEYTSGKLPLYHFDVYRISGEEEMFELGACEYFYGNGVCIVEWADKIAGLLPVGSTVIRIVYGENEHERIYEISRMD
ncbi:MAG: tRNA (adenosine(37)-N6)-threonylcarbamoyltransferase complex ATPase subunit type 1 TsaE [Clostridiales bacterium]|nr:tRNA (adenosine(37)-N6)-threonylcarbamoyltransferase complex ATPase subunit type 1 TsaE [Clostridiales bacterium]